MDNKFWEIELGSTIVISRSIVHKRKPILGGANVSYRLRSGPLLQLLHFLAQIAASTVAKVLDWVDHRHGDFRTTLVNHHRVRSAQSSHFLHFLLANLLTLGDALVVEMRLTAVLNMTVI